MLCVGWWQEIGSTENTNTERLYISLKKSKKNIEISLTQGGVLDCSKLSKDYLQHQIKIDWYSS